MIYVNHEKDTFGNSIINDIPKKFDAGEIDKLTFALRKFGDQQIHTILKFDGLFDRARIRKAVRLMMDKEPVLGCRFIEHPKNPYWQRRADLDSLNYCSFVDSKSFEEELQEFIISPCDPRVDLGLQIRIYRNGNQDILCLKSSHAIIDGGGIIDYLTSLGNLYVQLKDNPTHEIQSNITGSRKLHQVLKQFNFLQRLFIFLKNRSPKPNWAFPWKGTNAINPDYIIRRFKPGKFKKMKSFAKKHNATINDMLLTAFYRSVFKIINPPLKKKLVSVVTVNLRTYLPNNKAESICNLSTSAYPQIEYFPNEYFTETLLRVRNEMKLRKKLFPGIGPAAFLQTIFRRNFTKIIEITKNRFDNDLKKGVTHPVFTNVGLVKTDNFDYGEIKPIDGYLMTPIVHAPGFIMGAMTFNETMSLCLGFYEDSYDKKLIEEFIDSIDKELDL